MKKIVFDFDDYKAFLLDWLAFQPAKGHGIRAELAKALGCQSAYISQVLRGTAHFSLEQAEALNRYLGQTKEESEFLYLLILKARAGTEALRAHFRESIEKMRAQRLILKNRLEARQELTEQDRARYYSAWYFAAVHLALTIPGLNTKAALARRLGLDTKKIAEILEFLEAAGLVTQAGDQFKAGSIRIHLGNDSPEIARHHTNWRLRAMEALDREEIQDFHYSSIVSLAKDDIKLIKEELIRAVEAAKARIKESPPEELCVLNLDFFSLK
jgi:uncharacterized protein (TIGR02147 family)